MRRQKKKLKKGSQMTSEYYFDDIGVCILSWQGYDSLRNALMTYQERGFISMFAQFKVLLPEGTNDGVEICKSFNVEPIVFEQNLGILGGFEGMGNVLSTKYGIFLENDLPLYESREEVYRQINNARNAFETGEIVQASFKHRDNPNTLGELIAKTSRYYPRENATVFQKFMAGLRRTLRPKKALRMVGATVYYRDDAQELCPQYIKKCDNGAYILDAKVLNWSNMAFMINREFFLEKIIKFAKEANTTRRINGFKNLEIEMNSPYWKNSGWKIMVHQGLFKHERQSYRGY